jgi:DNA-binding NtrC family response regulator
MSGSATTPPRQMLIYLVDDEELLLNLAEVALCKDGYALKKFQNPELAFEAFTRETSKPSLLLTDYAMKPIDGLELSARCKSAHPSLKILLVSGTVDSDFVQSAPVRVDFFISKPYEPAHLARTVRSLLASDAV